MKIEEVVVKKPLDTPSDAKKAEEKFERFMTENGLEDYPDPKKLLSDGYVYVSTEEGGMFIMDKRLTTKAIESEEERACIYFPTQFIDTPVLQDVFGVVRLSDGSFYTLDSVEIIKPHGCRNYYKKSECFKCDLTGNYYINGDDLIENVEEYDKVHKSHVVHTVDTGEMKIKERCYRYRNCAEVEYYRYRQLAPDYRYDGSPVWFDETVKNKRGIVGIELEYTNGAKLCLETLRTKKFRDIWSTVRDGSLPPDGAEFVSVPLELNELHNVSDFIYFAQDQEAKAHRSCGYHVHISGKDMNYMDISSLVNLCFSVQGEVFDLVDESRINNNYCKLLDNRFTGFSTLKYKKDKIKAGGVLYGDDEGFKQRHQRSKYAPGSARHYWLNIDRMFRFRKREDKHQKTIEFRLYQADFNVPYFMNMILLFYYMVEFAKTKSQKTCRRASLIDVVNIAPYHHRKQLRQLIK